MPQMQPTQWLYLMIVLFLLLSLFMIYLYFSGDDSFFVKMSDSGMKSYNHWW